MGTRAAPPLLGHPWQKQHMEVHMAISKHVGTPRMAANIIDEFQLPKSGMVINVSGGRNTLVMVYTPAIFKRQYTSIWIMLHSLFNPL